MIIDPRSNPFTELAMRWMPPTAAAAVQTSPTPNQRRTNAQPPLR